MVKVEEIKSPLKKKVMEKGKQTAAKKALKEVGLFFLLWHASHHLLLVLAVYEFVTMNT